LLSETDSIPRIGQVVRILQGREAGHYRFLVIDGRYVLVADGENVNMIDQRERAHIILNYGLYVSRSPKQPSRYWSCHK
jgi:hypothetical protein